MNGGIEVAEEREEELEGLEVRGVKEAREVKGVGKMKKSAILVALFAVLFALSSCSPSNVRTEDPKPMADDDAEVSVPTVEAAAEEGPVFTYDDNKIAGDNVPEIYLTYSSEPVSIPGRGYVKFKGAITGERPVAVVEIAGKGAVLGLGDAIGDYAVTEIKEGSLRLERGMKCARN